MAVVIKTNDDGTSQCSGLTADTKPITGMASLSTFWELDGKKGWIYDEKNVNPLTGNGWWTL